MMQSANILLVSAHPDQHKALVQHLQKYGYDISLLGMDALSQSIGKREVDVILIDASSPYLDIFKFIRRLRSDQSTACVLLMGPVLDAVKVGAFLRAGVFDYLKAPFPFNRLTRAIRKGLKTRQDLLHTFNLSDRLERTNQKLVEERDRLQRWSEDLSRLHALNQTLSESLDIEGVAQSFFTNLKKVVAYDVACLFLKGEGRARIAADQTTWGPFLGRISEETVKEGQIFLKAERILSGAMVRNAGSEIVVPLTIGTKRMGLLRLIRLSKEAFDDYQSKVLSMVSPPLALAIRNAEMHHQVQNLAVKDDLTGILNRRAFSNALEREWKRAQRYEAPLSLIVIDLDYFKKVNDVYGHLVGDQVLREMASVFKESIREVDILARYGGEEFVVLLPGTNIEEALVAARRMKEGVQTTLFNPKGEPVRMTVSMGVAHYPLPQIKTSEAFFRLADQALYQAKRTGRNRIVLPYSVGDPEEGILTSDAAGRA